MLFHILDIDSITMLDVQPKQADFHKYLSKKYLNLPLNCLERSTP